MREQTIFDTGIKFSPLKIASEGVHVADIQQFFRNLTAQERASYKNTNNVVKEANPYQEVTCAHDYFVSII